MMKRITVLMMTVLLGAVSLWACPAYSKPVDVFQPDGTTVTLLMRGDEFQSFITTTDGYTVIKGADGFYRYAEKDGDRLKASAFVAHNAAERTAAELSFLSQSKKMIRAKMSEAGRRLKEMASKMYSAAYQDIPGSLRRAMTPGTMHKRIDYNHFKGLVILVNWNDRSFLYDDTNNFYQKLTNQRHYTDDSKTVYPYNVKGSVRDYFYDNSMGMFDPTFDVVGPVTIDYSCEYPKATDADGNIPEGYRGRVNDILKAVMTEVDKTVDFNDYDLDNDGIIDMTYLIFAGYGSYVLGNNMNYIWPHANDYSQEWGSITYADYFGFPKYDGKKFGRYACSVEIEDRESQASAHQYLCGIGTMCHEFSHVLGLADHYDMDYGDNGLADYPGEYDVMASGSYLHQGLSPVGYNAFERKILGFADDTITELEAGDYELEPLNTSNTAYIVKTDKDGEVFYIENRQRTGWDEFIPGTGLLVWRADTSKPSLFTENKVNNKLGEECVQLLGNSPVTSTDLTVDNNAVWGAKGAVLDLYDITETNGVITFRAGVPVYPSITEDFEDTPLTEGDASEVLGKFCQWKLTNAKIVQAGDYGNGQHVAQIGKSGNMVCSKFKYNLRTMSFTVQNSDMAKIFFKLEKSSDGIKWEQTAISLLEENEERNFSLKDINAESYIRMVVLTDKSSAAAYIDDINVTLLKETDDISTVNADKLQQSDGAWYTLSGQRVAQPARKGLYIVNGHKVVIK